MMRRTGLLSGVVGLVALGAMSGCHGNWNAYIGGVASPAAVVLGSPVIFYASAAGRHGPSAIFNNESDTRLTVRYWVGRIDCRAPGGVTDWRSPEWFEIEPGRKVRTELGRNFWITANSDAVVRVRVAPVVASADGTPGEVDPALVQWYEFDRTPPYYWKAVGTRDALTLERFGDGGGTMTPVPASEWFDVNDDLPVIPGEGVALGGGVFSAGG